MAKRNEIVETARELIGVPWVHQGRTIHGIDCGGVVVYVAKAHELSNFDTVGYGRRPNKYEFVNLFVKGGAIRIPTQEAQHGDIVVTFVRTFPSHCGILGRELGRGGWKLTFIHAYAPYRKVIESPYDTFWRERTWGAFKFPGVED